MKKSLFRFLLFLCIILLSGISQLHAQLYSISGFNTSYIAVKKENSGELFSNKVHSFEFKKLRRKACLLDNEEKEEEFSSIQKQLVKSSFFLNVIYNNKLATLTSTFISKKVGYFKSFNLLSNKVYLLFQVFRI